MRTLGIIAVSILCAACSVTPTIPHGQTYSSPIAGFKCKTDLHFDTRAQEEFGPHGGVVRLITELDLTRIDIVEFSPKFPLMVLSGPQLQDFHAKYLAESLMPLIRTGVPDASLLGQESSEINRRRVYISAVLLPGRSSFMYPNGKYADGIRSQVQFTNGQFMYIVSRIDHVRSEQTAESQLKTAYEYVSKAFGACSFPD